MEALASMDANSDPELASIHKHRLDDLLYLEKNLDHIVHDCAIACIMEDTKRKSEGRRLKRITKKMNQTEAIQMAIDAFFADTELGSLEGVRTYLEKNGVCTVLNESGDTALHICVRNKHKELLLYFLECPIRTKVLLNLPNVTGDTALHIASKLQDEFTVRLLLERGANTDVTNDEGSTPLHCAAKSNSAECVRLLLSANADCLIADGSGNTPVNLTTCCTIQCALNHHRRHIRVWSGWSFEDIQQTDTIFTEHAANYSYCPLCLKFFERSSGCMYMSHNCAAEGRIHHKKLFRKYVTVNSETGSECIQWCSICNRVSGNNCHYSIASYDHDGHLQQPGNICESDCRISSSGGGLVEKYARFLELRKAAHALNESIGDISENNAVLQLVESMWNAPFVHKKPRIIPWKLSTSSFPPRSEIPVQAPVEFHAPVKRPEEDTDLLPEIHAAGYNCISLETDLRRIQFKHRMEDGTVNDHDEEYINCKTLLAFLKQVIHEYKTGLNCEPLGYCWFRMGDCTAVLYPEEIRYAFTLLECNNKEYAEVLSEYEGYFQEKFGSGITVR